jgi:hypothetical protein
VRGHGPDDGLGEGAALARGADQDGGADPADHLLQRDAAELVVPLPVGDLVGGAGVGLLEVAQAVLVLGEQPVPVDGPEAAGGVLVAEAVRGQGVPELVGDADPGRARAEDDDAVLAQGQRSGPVGL